MNPYRSYQQNRSATQPRIDTILSLFEQVLERLEKARAAMRNNEVPAAQKQLATCQLGISGLASGFDPRGGELASTLLRLYEFVGRCLISATEANIDASLKTLRPLYEGFLGIRAQAVQMERSGVIPPLEQARTFQATA